VIPVAGLNDPNVVDLITYDEPTGEYALIMVAGEPWSDTNEQLTQLLLKMNTYLMFVVDGGFASSYPEATGKPVRLQLDCIATPTGSVLEVLEHMRPKLTEYDIQLVVNVLK
jgi:hypothetical protein